LSLVIIWRVFWSSHFGAGSFFWQSSILAKSGFQNRLCFFGQKFWLVLLRLVRQIHFAGKVVFSTSKVFVSQAFLVKFVFHLVRKFLKQFGFGSSSFVFGYLAFWQVRFFGCCQNQSCV
jgi:hypothetical protein